MQVKGLSDSDIVKLNAFVEMLDGAKRIVALTGAGISVPSGIPDFRSATGLYSTPYGAFNTEEMISHDFFKRHTEEFFKFYREKLVYPAAEPNDAHTLLAYLESKGKLSAVATQNIDGLHQRAGSKKVYELHGSVLFNTCMKCGKRYGLKAVTDCVGVPKCDCGGIIKPDVVLYGEELDMDVYRAAQHEISNADMLLVIGTSLNVNPAAYLAYFFEGGKKVTLNKSSLSLDADLDLNMDCALAARYALDKWNAYDEARALMRRGDF